MKLSDNTAASACSIWSEQVFCLSNTNRWRLCRSGTAVTFFFFKGNKNNSSYRRQPWMQQVPVYPVSVSSLVSQGSSEHTFTYATHFKQMPIKINCKKTNRKKKRFFFFLIKSKYSISQTLTYSYIGDYSRSASLQPTGPHLSKKYGKLWHSLQRFMSSNCPWSPC